jgi:hypothetical protein
MTERLTVIRQHWRPLLKITLIQIAVGTAASYAAYYALYWWVPDAVGAIFQFFRDLG